MGGFLNPANLLNGKKSQDDDKLEDKDKQRYGEFDILFQRFDINKTETLDNNEMLEAIHSYLQKHPEKEEQINSMLKSIDMSGIFRIKSEEFRILMISYVGDEIKEEELLIEIFKYFDKNLTGTIGSDELMHVFGKLGLNLSKTDADKLINEVDEDGNNTIDFTEFCRIMLSK